MTIHGENGFFYVRIMYTAELFGLCVWLDSNEMNALLGWVGYRKTKQKHTRIRPFNIRLAGPFFRNRVPQKPTISLLVSIFCKH